VTGAAAAQSQSSAGARVSGSSFYSAMRILPPAKREAMFEIYGFCRAVDDIADDGGPRETRLAGLQHWRADIDRLYAGEPPPHLATLARVVASFGLGRLDFHAIIDGMEMDVLATIRAPDLATLDLYCDRVASAVGRLSVRVFGMETGPGLELAHHLGRALQLTNILRDLDEDAAIGRLYLPAEALGAAGIAGSEPQAVLASPAIGRACNPVAETAKEHFRQAEKIMAGSPRAVVRAPRIMAAAYRLRLDGMIARGWQPPRTPVKVPRARLIWILFRNVVL
jgi:phytoene synthase